MPGRFATLWLNRSASARAKCFLPFMLRFFVPAAAFTLVACAATPQMASPIADAPRYEDFADDWLAFHDATEGLPMAQRTAAFDRDVATKFPGFFRDRYQTAEDKAASKPASSGASMHSTTCAMPLSPGMTHSPAHSARMSRASLKSFPISRTQCRSPLSIRLARWMAERARSVTGNGSSSGSMPWCNITRPESDGRAFFAHELFHVYHGDHLGACDAVWCSLWSEGLATHVAATLNPDATEQDLLLNIPAEMSTGVRAAPGAVARDLLRVFDSEDPADYSPRFTSRKDASGLPPRRGYYLG